MYATRARRERRSVIHSTLLNVFLTLLRVRYRYLTRLYVYTHRPIVIPFLNRSRTAFLAATICPSAYRRCDCAGPNTTLVLPRGAVHLDRLDRTLESKATAHASTGRAGRTSRALYVPFFLVLVSTVLPVAPHRNSGSPSTSH